MSTKIRICILTSIGIMLQCITFMAYAQNIGGACITSLTYTTSDASSYIVQKVYANGNMTKDRNKGISNITYNTMNLPSRIEFENGSRATYLYSADGTKLQVKYETSYAGLLAYGPPSGSASTAIAQTHTIDYVGDKIYEDGVLSRILIEGGYVDYSGETPIYHTYLTDHQGNVRVVVDENAAVKQVNHYYPYVALFAESTNGNVQPYKYTGKELDRMHGLDWYDHGARHNDAAIGRWHVMDPLCEKYYDVSPYAYCHNNPIMLVDLDGMDDYYDYYGYFLFSDNEETDNIIIRSWVDFSDISIPIDKKIDEIELPAESYSNIFTNTLALLPSSDGVNVESLYNGKISVVVWNIEDANVKMSDNYYNNPSMVGDAIATTSVVNDNALITAYVSKDETMFFTTRSNI